MADIIELIRTRRNVTEFIPKEVSWGKISKIIDAGRHAPSCGNLQNWKFIVVADGARKLKMAEFSYDQYEIAMAAALIVVCAEEDKVQRYYGIRGVKLYSIQNCAAAIQNMLLEAHSLDLGGRWIGAFDEDKVKDLCSIPPEVRPQAIIAIGYPKAVPPKPPKYPMETVTYFEKWRNKLTNPDKYLKTYSALLAKNVGAAKEMAQSVAKGATHHVKKAKPHAKSLSHQIKGFLGFGKKKKDDEEEF